MPGVSYLLCFVNTEVQIHTQAINVISTLVEAEARSQIVSILIFFFTILINYYNFRLNLHDVKNNLNVSIA